MPTLDNLDEMDKFLETWTTKNELWGKENL